MGSLILLVQDHLLSVISFEPKARMKKYHSFPRKCRDMKL
ncbi:MAG: hypothetical protein QOH31_3993 [Verrucomicrobiota bacterium]|jgi:hypothetical protein